MSGSRAHIAKFDDLDWDDLRNPGGGSRLPAGRVSAATRAGVRRMTMSEGHCGFHIVHASMPADHHVRSHRHPHDEVITVLRGSIQLEGEGGTALVENDLIVIPANHYYGFTVGSEGVDFLVMRLAQTDTIDADDDLDTAEVASPA
jgi:quercetin dioxygenase-like cupin family protein